MPPKRAAKRSRADTPPPQPRGGSDSVVHSPKKFAPAVPPTPKAAGKKGAKADFEVDPEIPMTKEGVIYHLGCTAKDLADNIILVGDPGRVPKVASFFDSQEFQCSHREISIITGKYKGLRVSCLSTGMGTDNIEIVINEIHALKEYNVSNGEWLKVDKDGKNVPKINMIRVGTCGCPQGDVECGTLAVTRFAIGMDNTCQYYIPHSESTAVKALHKLANDKKKALGEVGVYTAEASAEVNEAILKSAAKFAKNRKAISGITASGSGFYGCQGRSVGRFRGSLRIPDLVDRLGALRLPAKDAGTKEDQRVVNIEMENSAICFLSSFLGYRAGTVCAIIATRAGDVRHFATPTEAASAINDAIITALDALLLLQKK
jgi:uridine phosphorylase